MDEMSKRERLEAATAGRPVDRPPVALWRHFPVDDQDPVGLAKSVVAFQRQYDFDFVKVTPASSYCVCGWGAQDCWEGNPEGTREYRSQPIRKPEDWFRLEPLNPGDGALGAQLRCLGLIGEDLGAHVPFIDTVFSPLAQAKNLAGRQAILAHLRQHPRAVLHGLEVIAQTTEAYVQAACTRGIAGIFYAVQHASYEVLSEQEYREFGVPFDLRVLRAAEALWLNVLHLHGTRVMFDLLADYPVQVVNWHDRETPPSLLEGQRRIQGVVLGGLRQWETMVKGTPELVCSEASDAIATTGGNRFILGTGCVTPVTAPWANLRAARASVNLP
ncbi:MAG TPA: uroporphyrinogen decarboxylase family protein [Anaerolineae bacterium]|nr:uroporphyrinogen decarboxylase family protein [Anaerolineae bacterium]